MLEDFWVSTTAVDVSAGAAEIQVRIEASDDLAGFGSGSTGNGSIDIRHTDGSNPFGRGSLPITGGTLLNPTFEFTLTVPAFSKAGEYPITLRVIDNVFNGPYYDADDLAALGFPHTITVTNGD